jgi:hypothetical protein
VTGAQVNSWIAGGQNQRLRWAGKFRLRVQDVKVKPAQNAGKYFTSFHAR